MTADDVEKVSTYDMDIDSNNIQIGSFVPAYFAGEVATILALVSSAEYLSDDPEQTVAVFDSLLNLAFHNLNWNAKTAEKMFVVLQQYTGWFGELAAGEVTQ